MTEKIFDIHTHVYPEKIASRAAERLGEFYGFTVGHAGTCRHLERHSREAGVSGILLLGVATNACQTENVNTYIAKSRAVLAEHGYKAYGFMGMHQDYPDFEREVLRAQEMGLSGIKIHPDIQGVNIDDRRLYDLYSVAQGRMPIYFHMGDDRARYRYSEARRLLRVLRDFPRLTVCAAHFGGYKAWDDAVECLGGHERIMFDTSSSLAHMTVERARDIISRLGSENLMFGTDYPTSSASEELERFNKIPLSSREREDILWNSAARFLKIN